MVWLVGGAFMFALGYEKTGLGRRIALRLVCALGRNTLSLGYAAVFAEAILAPFTPSNTARGAGIIFPIMNNLPPLYDSRPHDPSARKIGGYIMWVAFSADCVTSTLFMTAVPSCIQTESHRHEIQTETLPLSGIWDKSDPLSPSPSATVMIIEE
jgi:L-tartrate/succinate antiporter